jgi:hemerythrin-like domain-containing protein
MDALDLLEEQHQDLSELFAQVHAAETAGRRTALVAQLVRAIEAHSRVEETVFYAAFSARIETDEARLWEAFENHALLRFAAHNLLRTRATDVRFAARLKLVHQLFRRHAHTEEDWMFPKAKRALHDEVLDRIGTEIERAHAARISVTQAGPERLSARRRIVESGARRRMAAPSML